MPRFTHRKVIPIGGTARVVAQRAPETLTLVRHRTQSAAETIARLSVTAVFAYLDAACYQQDRLGELMRADPAAGQATWPLRGELISQPDRLGHELGEGKPERSPRRLRRSWRRLRPARLRPPRRLRCRLPACAGVPQPTSHGWVARAWRTPQVLRES